MRVLRSLESVPVQGPPLSEPDSPFDVPIRDVPSREAAMAPPAAQRSSISGLLIWLAAASALVVGIVIGFASGYAAGQRSVPAPAAGQTFSEAAIAEPIQVEEPAPIVTEPEPIEPTVAAASNVTSVSTGSTVSNVPNESRPGSIDVLSRPSGAQVILDGRRVGRTPLTLPDVTPGEHDVRLELPGHNRWATRVDVKPGARARVAASLEQP